MGLPRTSWLTGQVSQVSPENTLLKVSGESKGQRGGHGAEKTHLECHPPLWATVLRVLMPLALTQSCASPYSSALPHFSCRGLGTSQGAGPCRHVQDALSRASWRNESLMGHFAYTIFEYFFSYSSFPPHPHLILEWESPLLSIKFHIYVKEKTEHIRNANFPKAGAGKLQSGPLFL